MNFFLRSSIFACGLFCISCSSSDSSSERTIIEKEVTEERTLFSKSVNDSLSLALRSKVSTYTFSTKQDTQLVSLSGLKVHIPSGIFVDENNQVVANVTLTLLDASKPVDFVMNNLATESDGELLESGGMFYINAEANGKPLKLKDGSAFLVQKPTKHQVGDMQVFYGNYTPEGKLNWTPVGKAVGSIDNSMIAYPLSYMNYDSVANVIAQMSPMINPHNPKISGILQREIKTLNDPKFEDTYICTKEFNYRLAFLSWGAPLNPDTTLWGKVLDIYKNGVDAPLYKADQEVIEFLSPHAKALFKMLSDSIQIDSMEYKTKPKDKNDLFGLGDGKLLRHSILKNVGTLIWEYVCKMPEMKLSRPINFTKLGVTATTTRNDLIQQGYSDEDASRLLFYYKQREEKLRLQFTDEKNEAKQKEILHYTLSVKKFGWVNIDRLLSDTSAKETNFTVEIPGADTLKGMKVNLVIPERGVCTSNSFYENGHFSFTKKGTVYRKLPLGTEAFVVALSASNGNNYSGIKKFKIPASGSIKVEMESGSPEEIKERIEAAIK